MKTVSGSGKTAICATATSCKSTAPVLVLDAGGQPITYTLFDPLPLIVILEGMKDLNFPYRWLAAGQPWNAIADGKDKNPFCSAVWEYFDGEENRFNCLVIDSITQVQRLSIARVGGMEQFGPGDDPKTLDIRSWGGVLSQMTTVADTFFSLPIHVLMTALASHDAIPQLNIVKCHPLLQGQSARELPSKAELVGFIKAVGSLTIQQRNVLAKQYPNLDDVYSIMYTLQGSDFQAKWQGVTKNPGMIVDPTIDKLIQVLNNG